MDPVEYLQLWDYAYWARDRLLGAARGMSEADYALPNGFVYPSVRAVMTHLLGAENIWLSRWQGEDFRRIPPEEVPTLEALEARWAEVEGRMRSFVHGLTPESLRADVVIRSRDGSVSQNRLDQTMTMMLFHQAQHRSEA